MAIKLNGSTSGSVALDAPADTSPSGTDVTLTLPTSAGSSGQVLTTDGSGTLSFTTLASDSITEGNTTVECVDTGSDGHITFDTEGSEAARFDSGGRFLVNGTTSQTVTGGAAKIQVSGTSASGDAHISCWQYCDSADGAELILGSSRGSTVGSTTVVQSGDRLGRIRFGAGDGSDLTNRAAEIKAEVDATPGSDDTPARLVFGTASSGSASATERMRLRNNGNLRINMNNFGADVSGSNTGVEFTPGVNPVLRLGTGDATTNNIVEFYNTNGLVGMIRTSGSSSSYNTSSDYRLKENVVDLDGAIDRVKQLAPKRFNFIADAETTVDGFIAHEAQTVVPEAISGVKDEIAVWKENDELPDGVSVGDNKLDEDGNTIPVYQGIDQSKLVPLLTAALQEAIAKIEALETANASQAATIAAFEARLTALEGGAA